MICANTDCKKDFTPKTHNQKYCSDECCRIFTNKRIMEKYYEKKEIRAGKIRACRVCKGQLSRYNQSNICYLCEKKNITRHKNIVLEIIDEIS